MSLVTSFNNLKLRTKVWGLVLIPFIGVIFLSATFININYKRYVVSQKVKSNIAFITRVQSLVHQMQIERGMSVQFVTGKDIMVKLREQRGKVDTEMEKFEAVKGDRKYHSYQAAMSALTEIRNQVNNRQGETDGSSAAKAITELIGKLFSFYIDSIDLQYASEINVSADIGSLRLLEEAKENNGKMRANLSGIFVADAPV